MAAIRPVLYVGLCLFVKSVSAVEFPKGFLLKKKAPPKKAPSHEDQHSVVTTTTAAEPAPAPLRSPKREEQDLFESSKPFPRNLLRVSTPDVAELLQTVLDKHCDKHSLPGYFRVENENHPPTQPKFPQDAQVVLPSGALLLPYSFEEAFIQQTLKDPSDQDPPGTLGEDDDSSWGGAASGTKTATAKGRLEPVFKALWPRHAVEQFLVNGGLSTNHGGGFGVAERRRALEWAATTDYVVREGRTCVEGGNTRWATNKHGERVAIVGEFSLALSVLALMEQSYDFSGAGESGGERDGPSDHGGEQYTYTDPSDFLRLARNLQHARRVAVAYASFMKMKRKTGQDWSIESMKEQQKLMEAWSLAQHNGDLSKPRMETQFVAEPSLEEKEEFAKEGDDLRLKFAVAHQIMAKELEVSGKNLVVVRQGHFHIDVELFAVGETVFLNSAELALETAQTERLFPLAAQEHRSARAAPRSRRNDKNQKRFEHVTKIALYEAERLSFNRTVLARAGLRTALVPGVFGEDINFMNGLALSPAPQMKIFVTNDVSEREEGFFEIFRLAMARYSDIVGEVVMLRGGSGDERSGGGYGYGGYGDEAVMGRILEHTQGGLNCIVRYNPHQ